MTILKAVTTNRHIWTNVSSAGIAVVLTRGFAFVEILREAFVEDQIVHPAAVGEASHAESQEGGARLSQAEECQELFHSWSIGV